jgi:HlyD family secretion protein
MKTRTLMLAGFTGLAVVGATILQAVNAGSGWPKRAMAAPAPRGDRGLAAEGRVVTYPGDEVRVAAERAERILAVHVREGQQVRKGELLAEIESEELRAALAEARARVSEAEAELRLAEVNRERRGRLVKEGIAAPHDLDQANRDLEIARARVETAGATVARHEAQLDKSRILAPIGGSVTARSTDAGETVEAGDVVLTLANLGKLRIEGEVDEADAGSLTVGAPVVVTAGGYPGSSWSGKVEEIADSVTLRKLKPQDPARPTDTRILAVKVALLESTPLKLGTTVELRIARP